MPRVDFYILPDRSPNGRLLLACRLAEKAYLLGHTVYLHAESAQQARVADDWLWTFRPGSFVPHALHPAGPQPPPVLIGWGGDSDAAAQVLINLTHQVPAFYERFERVAELVDQDPRTLARCRERFRWYKAQGVEPGTHRL